MSGTILENLSTKKLTILVVSLLLLQFSCFLIGGLVGELFLNILCLKKLKFFKINIPAPIPASVQTILATVCQDVPGSHNDTSIWLYSRGKGSCKTLTQNEIENHDVRMANQIVFVFQVRIFFIFL